MNKKTLLGLGFEDNKLLKKILQASIAAIKEGEAKEVVMSKLSDLKSDPEKFLQDAAFGKVAREFTTVQRTMLSPAKPVEFAQWGEDLDPASLQQMQNACSLPVSVSGALMPDAHLGYGLPIGGVLATKNAVIPYAVGVDIACRMKMTVLDWPVSSLERKARILSKAIEDETRFGIGSTFKRKRSHKVLDADWTGSPVLKRLKDKAWAQLGTSGSGNHFVEFGELVVKEKFRDLEPGSYLALLSHSGSRGSGAMIASHYSKIAQQTCIGISHQLRHLAWLDLDSQEGQEYWYAMEMMGQYASANHACIHKHVAKNLGAHVLAQVENHHNYAWKEVHNGKELVVHRKGATPAGAGVLGIIPGSMGDPGFIVRGRGNAASLNSASHGAGRKMSRTAAKNQFTWKEAKAYLEERNVTLLSAGLDEVPMAYKNILDVMRAQQDLVDTLAMFKPRLVKMAPAGERPED